MSLFKLGEKDADGRQKRVEHTGRYLRASRTGGIALRGQVKAAGINLTGNTSHGVRVSTRLAKNTQVAMQNGRFVLRGRYGSDAAKFNLSKSGVTVSSKTDVGTFNWVKPGRSSFKWGGIQLRGHNAAYLNAAYMAVKLALEAIQFAFKLAWRIGEWIVRVVGYCTVQYQLAQEAKARLNLSVESAQATGQTILNTHAVDLNDWDTGDLLAAMIFTLTVLGRGDDQLDAERSGITADSQALAARYIENIQRTGEQVKAWLGQSAAHRDPAAICGVMVVLTVAWAARVSDDERSQAIFLLDDACLQHGPRTLLQEELIDLLPAALGVELETASTA